MKVLPMIIAAVQANKVLDVPITKLVSSRPLRFQDAWLNS
jgi:hypothetical protein